MRATGLPNLILLDLITLKIFYEALNLWNLLIMDMDKKIL